MEITLQVQRKVFLPAFDTVEQKLSFRRRIILLAEDDEDLRYVTEHALRAMGHLLVGDIEAFRVGMISFMSEFIRPETAFAATS